MKQFPNLRETGEKNVEDFESKIFLLIWLNILYCKCIPRIVGARETTVDTSFRWKYDKIISVRLLYYFLFIWSETVFLELQRTSECLLLDLLNLKRLILKFSFFLYDSGELINFDNRILTFWGRICSLDTLGMNEQNWEVWNFCRGTVKVLNC